jgi:hypothetical protein
MDFHMQRRQGLSIRKIAAMADDNYLGRLTTTILAG